MVSFICPGCGKESLFPDDKAAPFCGWCQQWWKQTDDGAWINAKEVAL